MMDIKQILLSDASTDAKLSALAILIDKQFPKLESHVLEVEKLQGPVGDKGDKGDQGPQGERGKDGKDGKNGSNGKDGVDGKDGENGVSIDGVKIDFDGSLVVTLTDGRVINVGEIVPIDVAEKIRTVHNIQIGSGGDSQTVLDAIAALQATIATYGTMATQNSNNVAITGGTINNTTIGATTPSTGVFTTLTATGQTSLGGAVGSESFRAVTTASAVNWLQAQGGTTGNTNFPRFAVEGSDANVWMTLLSKGNAGIRNFANGAEQFRVSPTASAVNYVQVTGAATGSGPIISAQGSDANIPLRLDAKGGGAITFVTGGALQAAVQHTVSSVNYVGFTGSAIGNAVRLFAAGNDTNISQVFQSKGTGAIDLAAGSRGVNISNGGTVTAVTVTSAISGSTYTSIPTVAVSVPTTAGGVQAVLSLTMGRASQTIISGGTGYTVNDNITVVGGTFTQAVTYIVASVSGGVITGLTVNNAGTYTVLPTGTLTTTGGTGTGLTLTLDTWGVRSATVTTAGSGYVEQPTVTFSGGGGIGAAAFAVVGSQSIIKGIGTSSGTISNQSIMFQTPSGNTFLLRDSNQGTNDAHLMTQGTASGYAIVVAEGSNANASMYVGAKGTGSVRFNTRGTSLVEQMRVSDTASAVNYVQVTGAATGGGVTVSAQGSDTNVSLVLRAKGSNEVSLGNGNTFRLFSAIGTSGTNYLQVTSSATTVAPVLSAQGSDTNIDLTLTPKGTGNVRFGTYTGTALSIAGYIEIKDSGGTVRKLAVVA